MFLDGNSLMKKADLRQQYLIKRQQLTLAEYEKLNEQLLQGFQQLDLSGIRGIHLYLPIKHHKEPDTFQIRHWLQQEHPEILRIFPRADFADQSMQHYADDEELELVENGFGIPEPIFGNLVNMDQINLIIVPLLAFDLQGFRVGYGKGFYDRFLAKCSPSCWIVGLSYFDPVKKIEDNDFYDIPMHNCITPRKIWEFMRRET